MRSQGKHSIHMHQALQQVALTALLREPASIRQRKLIVHQKMVWSKAIWLQDNWNGWGRERAAKLPTNVL